jgi:predicted Zn-dependent protease
LARKITGRIITLRLFNSFIVILALLGAGAPPSLAQPAGELPEMGDSSSTVLSAEDELRIGKEMLRQLEANGALADDPIINEYIQNLGSRIAANTDATTTRFTFFLVNANSVNAFAMPGGFIGVHAGLLLTSESENEVASVIAHEIAHVTQHHIARGVEQANKMQLPLTAAVIAAILLGAQDPQVANAAIAAAVGGSQQMQLNFTRANEHEADRVGMQLLAASDYDPRGMADFFARLQQETRYYGSGIPEFLSTHPVTTTRIAEAQERAAGYPARPVNNSPYYTLVKARLALRYAASPEHLLQQLEARKSAGEPATESDTYLRAMIQEKLGNITASRTLYQNLLARAPERIAFIHGLAELENSQGSAQKAADIYRKGLKVYPGNTLLSLALAETLIRQREYPPARKLLEQQVMRNPSSRESYRVLARLESASGNKAASHIAQAEYYYLSGESHSAIDQLNTARRQGSLDHYHLSRIEARLSQIKDELERAELLSR